MRTILTHADGTVEVRDPRTLDDARAEAVARVRQGFEAALAAGWLHADSGKIVQTDEASTVRLAQMAQAAALGLLPAGFAWRMADNTSVPFAPAALIAMAGEVGQHVYGLRVRMWAGVDAARAAASVAAADGIAF